MGTIFAMRAKLTLPVAFLGVLLCASSFAKTITDDKMGVSVDLPDDWKLEEGKRITATSDDGVMLIVVRFDRELPDVIIKRLADEMVPIMDDAKAADDLEKVVVHGIQAQKFTGHAKRDEKAVKFTCLLLSKDSTSTFAVIALGPETRFKQHLRDIDTALDSVRPKE